MKFICYHNMPIAIRKLQFVKRFSSLQMSFCIFSKNCKSLKSYTSWIFRVIHLTSYIISYFKAIKYPLLNNNMISQKFKVHIISSFILAYFLIFFFYIINIYTFENKNHNHQADIFLCTWDLIQQEPIQRSY